MLTLHGTGRPRRCSDAVDYRFGHKRPFTRTLPRARDHLDVPLKVDARAADNWDEAH